MTTTEVVLATDIAGGRNQSWISLGALQRRMTRYAVAISFAQQAVIFFLIGALAYVGSLPREVPYVLRDQNGTVSAIERAVDPTFDDMQKLLVDWIGACRVGSSDPASMAARQCSSLVPAASGNTVAVQIRAFNQSVAEGKLTVVPSITDFIAGSEPNTYEIRWNETSTRPMGVSAQRVMRAIVTVEKHPEIVTRTAALVNPWGVLVTDLRLIESAAK